MIKTLRESKAKLSELVEAAHRGEDVLISVRGKVKARLTSTGRAGHPGIGPGWARKLHALQRTYGTGRSKAGIDRILTEDREDRA